MTPPLKSSTSHLQHLQHLQQMQHHLQQPLYIGATDAEFGSTPQEDSNDSGHVSEVSGGGVCDPLGGPGDAAHSGGGGGDVGYLGGFFDALSKRSYVGVEGRGSGRSGGAVSFEDEVLEARAANARDDLTSLLYGTSGRVGMGRLIGGGGIVERGAGGLGIGATQSTDAPLRRLSHTSSMSRVTAANYASRYVQVMIPLQLQPFSPLPPPTLDSQPTQKLPQ